MIRVILDTNMFLSAILYHGMVKTILDLILANKLELCVSPTLKVEVVEKLKEYGLDKQSLTETVLFLDSKGISIIPNRKVTVCRDPKDNFVLELAETCQADYIITRDKDLLELSGASWKDTRIVKPEDFLPILRKTGLLN